MSTKTLTAGEADERALTAANKADELERRLRNGDQRITAKQIADARLEAEHTALLAEGARVIEEREARAEKEQAGRDLHDRWSEDAVAGLAEVDARLVAAGQAIHAALDALDNLDRVRNGYRARWSEHFRGDLETETAVAFKFGHNTSGDFGAVDQFHGIRKFDPLVLIAAVVAETSRGRDRNRMRSTDAVLWGQLQQSPYEVALRQLRTEINHFKKETEK